MTNIGRMVPAIESDWIGGPWDELWGDWLQHIYVPERMLPLPLGDVGCVYLVHRPHLWGKPLLSSGVWLPGLLLVITMWPLVLVFGN